MNDTRLSPVYAAIADGRLRVLSVDVFDTLLWRRVPEPSDIFLMLGLALHAAGKLAGDVSPAAFAELRRAAERAARAKAEAATGYREVRFPDIYAQLPASVFADGFSRDARIAAELACEARLAVADHAILALMKTAKDAGVRVILVSDCYFSGGELRGILAAAGCDGAAFDQLYVSCEAGRPKYRDLFDAILKDQGIAPAGMIHIGDNMEADIAPCRARGIGAVHYDKAALPTRTREREFPRDAALRGRILSDNGDLGLTGLRSRLAHRAPAETATDLRPYWRIGATALAPVFAGFARWIAGRCATKTVFGIMREGRFLARLVGETARALDVPLKTEEIWLSRRTVIGASLYADDLSQLTDFIIVAPGETVDEVLAALGLTLSEVTAVLPRFDLGGPNTLAALAHAITVVPLLKDKVVARSTRNRRNLLRGLARHIDLGKDQTITLMDLGYAATIQTLLARILTREGAKTRLEGLYFVLNERAAENRRTDTRMSAYLDDAGYGSDLGRLLTRTPDVLEHACMCRDGSLDRYGDAGEPVHLPNLRSEEQLAQMDALQDGILAGAASINRLLGGIDRTPHDAPTLKIQVARMLECLILHPTPEEAATIGAWQHEANLDITDRRRLTDLAFDPSALEYRGLAALTNVDRQNTYWPAAAFAQVSGFLADAYAAGASGVHNPALFTSGPLLGSLTVIPDAGNGFDESRAQSVPLSINAFGRGEITVTLKPMGSDSYTRVKLAWPSAQAVIAIIPPVFLCKGERETRGLAVNGLAWSGTKEIFQGVQLTTGDAEAIVDLGRPPAFPHAVEMTLRFKYLRLSPIFGTQ
ncbi:MAG: hypothetical protein K1X51_16940 [Rhodospirillaceae bacterium]|nr:hypothetical protein [Rhodospirillaceae bacterium]